MRYLERLGEFARRMQMSLEEAKQADNELVEHAFLIWKLDDERANLKSGNTNITQ